MGIVVLLVFNLISYFKEKEKIDPYITSFSYVFRILNEIKTLQNAKIKLFEDEMEELLRIKSAFGKFELFSFLIMSPGRMQGNPIEILIDYLRMFLHLDILKFNSMYHEIEKHRDKISRMLEIIGYIDAILAIGGGSAIDVAKCIKLYSKMDDNALYLEQEYKDNEVLLIAIEGWK